MRIKFDLPDKTVFSTEYIISISDINYGNHLGNDKVLSIANETRMRYLKSLGIKNELDFADFTGMVVADAAIMFKNEGFYGDVLTVHIGIDNIHKYGLDMYYQLLRKEDQKEIARIKTAILFMNYNTKKLTGIPKEFL